jgi:hypothetical protein
MTNFSVEVKRDGSTCTLMISGEVDLQNSDGLASIGRLALDAVNGHEVSASARSWRSTTRRG